jgi:Carboxypeptidase regulatory-like domain
MIRLFSIAALAIVISVPSSVVAQTSYRLKGTVKDEKGTAVAGARLRAQALQGFRGEQFVGQKEFATTTNEKGEWNILGLTSGIWTFEATAPGYAPAVIVLPVQYTQRKMQSATGGQLSWDLPITLGSVSNGMLKAASEAAAAGKNDEAISLAGGLAGEADMQTVCSGGHVALLMRQYSLASAMFRQIATRERKHPCAALGLASAALMQGDVITAGKLFWDARDLIPANQKRAVAAAIGDLQQITGMKQ